MIAIVDVSGTNLTSLANALHRLGFNYQLTHDAQEIRNASHVILPGVGTASYGMNALRQYDLVDVLTSLEQPLLGICLGMQLLLENSEEGNVQCLGLIPGQVRRLPRKKGYPVPHMGWNQLQWCKNTSLQIGLNETNYVYFVHSYALYATEHALAFCEYSESFTAIIQKNNIWGMQFHPEKSADTGMTLLKNFCST
ncbi:imidazole glycerol phosphate synthase subunit HisH [Legionella longbeachae]|uniref:Imidazole glycerol phosphate synthase subunit HisH n=1 Tax=Legionella longbeachae serogroup 1 (strain NSW150) TaxID=661367 RepID=D3HRY1_LEGLN|nr:imidazole glycerol phosphate synthase subunit HisH [Legionella longbeachae]VEE02162.1 imidazole glycerol phosphate synthase subunit HisH [Legionella oakridgensis]HBD7396595.1 imidazole glycerol phosphate synthase subunit HisH [Legionella pneumophila]ARB91536.1 imidazole glycerol phosphate synthase subunit HisH [Legionella longbeachae]EEZ95211.1 imidazole glycerol phosphate synthase subunit HisH [Legionella longbeachae D-4968]QEY51263.1 imidazole glycerol phosphate synthase subunit HisH [Leg